MDCVTLLWITGLNITRYFVQYLNYTCSLQGVYTIHIYMYVYIHRYVGSAVRTLTT
jgi:hypothetical protein